MVTYNPYSGNFYQVGQAPMMQAGPTPYVQQPQIPNTFAWVQGEAAAKAFAIQPGSTAVLLDSENPVLYMKSSDQSGRPTEMQVRYLVTKEQYEKLQNGITSSNMNDYITKSDFEKFVEDVNERFVLKKEYRTNGK